MKKQEMVYKNQVVHIRAERDVMALADNSWVVELKCAFQDQGYLYLVMEYLAGGDLMTLLMKKDILSEQETRFFIAETVLAIEEVHRLNYIHRDLKPDNILITSDGHVKLSDFGLCKHMEQGFVHRMEANKNIFEKIKVQGGKRTGFKRNRMLAYTTVGTPDYIAPEIFSKGGYTESVDWWSVGVIMFEMLVGYPPFFADSPQETCEKILNWRKSLVIPIEAKLSKEAIDLIGKLITESTQRIGVGEIKKHLFFKGINWDKLKNEKSPYVPVLKSETDTTYFDKFEEEEPWIPPFENKKEQQHQQQQQLQQQQSNISKQQKKVYFFFGGKYGILLGYQFYWVYLQQIKFEEIQSFDCVNRS